MMNMMNMMKQAQNIQKRLVEAQEELSHTDVTAESGNGLIQVTCDGKGIFKSIKISAEAINSENPASVSQDDIEMLEDLITSAMNSATAKSKSVLETKMNSVTGGVSIPGLM